MKTGIKFGTLLLAIALLGMAPAVSLAQDNEEVSNPDLKCLKCHSKNLKKKLEDGEKMSLRIDVEHFATSVHRVIGCTGCHRDVAKGKHPSKQPIASRRAMWPATFSISWTEKQTRGEPDDDDRRSLYEGDQ